MKIDGLFKIWQKHGDNKWFTSGNKLTYEQATEKVERFRKYERERPLAHLRQPVQYDILPEREKK